MNAFWLAPDWSGGDNLRDPGAEPFWMLPPLLNQPPEPRPGTYREVVIDRIYSGARDVWLVENNVAPDAE